MAGAPAGLSLWLSDRIPDSPLNLLSMHLGVVAAAVAGRVAARIWALLDASRSISFSDLMLWNHVRLVRTERRLQEGVSLLGLDSAGRPSRPARGSRAEQQAVLEELNRDLEAKDLYTVGHTRRVARNAYRIALAMRLPVEIVEEVRRAANVHDVGKINVPDEILRKPDKLTRDEYEIMKGHSAAGAEMTARLGDPRLTEIVRSHHERWDGGGYPDRLAGDSIPLGARIIAVADTYDAITTTRSYRARSKHRKAIAIIRAGAGKQFDPSVATAFFAGQEQRPAALGIGMGLFEAPQRLAGWLAEIVRSSTAGLAQSAVAAGGAMVIGAAVVGPGLMGVSPAPDVAGSSRARATHDLVAAASTVESPILATEGGAIGSEQAPAARANHDIGAGTPGTRAPSWGPAGSKSGDLDGSAESAIKDPAGPSGDEAPPDAGSAPSPAPPEPLPTRAPRTRARIPRTTRW